MLKASGKKPLRDLLHDLCIHFARKLTLDKIRYCYRSQHHDINFADIRASNILTNRRQCLGMPIKYVMLSVSEMCNRGNCLTGLTSISAIRAIWTKAAQRVEPTQKSIEEPKKQQRRCVKLTRFFFSHKERKQSILMLFYTDCQRCGITNWNFSMKYFIDFCNLTATTLNQIWYANENHNTEKKPLDSLTGTS